jgi:hypothetical protein
VTQFKLPQEIPETVFYVSDSPFCLITPIIMLAHIIINKAIEAKENILIHCEAGISRSSSVVIGHLILSRGFKAEDALKFVETSRPCIWPNRCFWNELKQLASSTTD